MKRFTFIRHANGAAPDDVSKPEVPNIVTPRPCPIPLPSETETPSSPELSRSGAKRLLQQALQTAGSGGHGTYVSRVCEVIAHAADKASIRRMLIEAGTAEALVCFLQQPSVRCNRQLVQQVLGAVLLMLSETTLAPRPTAEKDHNFALRFVMARFTDCSVTIIEEYIGDDEVVAAVGSILRMLLLGGGLKTRRVVLSSGIIRHITNTILTYTTHVDSILILSSTLKVMMDYSVKYQTDHSVAINDALSTMERHEGNIHVARIVCILLSQRKWCMESSRAVSSDGKSIVELLVRMMRQWKRDECSVRSALAALHQLLLTVYSATCASPAGPLSLVVTTLLSSQICDTLMELMYIYRKKSAAIVEIINVVTLLDSSIGQHPKADFTSLVAGLLSRSTPLSHSVIISTKMRVNEISMDYRWRERRAFCLFLSLLGCVYNPRASCCSSSPLAADTNVRSITGSRSCCRCHTESDHSFTASLSSSDEYDVNGDRERSHDRGVPVLRLQPPKLSPQRLLSPGVVGAVFSSRGICIAIAAFI